MLILEIGRICPHSNCPYDQPEGSCYGKRSDRTTVFSCEYADETKVLSDGNIRNPFDQTGKMKVIHG